LGWVLPHMKACKISDEIRRTEFFRGFMTLGFQVAILDFYIHGFS